MKAKLIRGKHSGEYLLNMEGVGYITTYESTLPYKLSLKNCQAIERGYDLDELAKEYAYNNVPPIPEEYENSKFYFKEGFQKALEILSNKKFTEEDVRRAMTLNRKHVYTQDEAIQSLQPNEWEVEIEMEPYREGDFINDGKTHSFEVKLRPVLDVNGCLILKKL